jgi:hypothetical protein
MHTISVSIPRSGHHYLMRRLRHYFDADWRYCEFYKPTDCCKTVPCTWPLADGMVSVQKSHDFKLELPKDPGCRYLVMARHIVPQTISNFEVAVGRNARPDTRAGFEAFARQWLPYYRGFVRKWALERPPRSELLVHERMIADPGRELPRIARFLAPDRPLDHARLSAAIAADPPRLTREVTDFRFYDEDFMDWLERQASDALAALNTLTEPRAHPVQ